MKKLLKILFAATFAAVLSIGGRASGQISGVPSGAAGRQSPGMAQASPDASALPGPESMPPEAAAFVYYFRIQVALSQDSLTNVAANALALAAVARKDTTGAFPSRLADQSSALARDAVTLPGARLDFAIVSGAFMNYLKVRNPPAGLAGAVRVVHDPVTRLYWLQTGDLLQNPYLGKSWRNNGTYVR